MKSNYRRGGLFLLPSTLIAIVTAIAFSAPFAAMLSIGICGFMTAIILISLGDRRQNDVNGVE